MLWWTVQNVVVTAVLAGVVWAVCRVGRVGPVVRHALWVVVLVKMVTPPLVAWPWGVGDPFARVTTAVNPIVAGGPVNLAASGRPDSSQPATDRPAGSLAEVVHTTAVRPAESDAGPTAIPIDTRIDSPPPTPGAAAVPLEATGPGTDSGEPVVARPQHAWLGWAVPAAGAAWAVGTAGYAFLQFVRIVRMSRRVRRTGGPASPAVVRLAAQVAERLGVKPVPVVALPGLGSPAVWAVGRPVLLWPADLPAATPAAAVGGLIAHELAHVRRRDHWVGWLELVAGCAWWWNPLFWYVRHRVREDAELACDAWAVDAVAGGRRAYAEGLLAVCECLSRRAAPPPPAVGVDTGGRRFLERRLAMILRERVALRVPRVGLLTIGLLVLTALPAWSQKAAGEPAEGHEAAAPATGLTLTYRPVPNADETTAQPPSPPDDVRDLMARHQQRVAEATAELIRGLEAARDRHAAAGHADVVAQLDPKIRQLRDEIGLRNTTATTIAGKGVLPDPGRLTEFRGNHYQPLTFEVVGRTDGTVWGTDVYTDDSPLAVAAVHAGLVRPGERAVVRVRMLPGRATYDGSARNGVTTSNYADWPGSYRVEPTPGRPAGYGPPPAAPGDAPAVLPADGTLLSFQDRVGQSFVFRVTGTTDRTIWGGPDAYTTDSPLTTAAVHAGVLPAGEEGVVRVTILPGRPSYPAEARNGLASQAWGAFPGSYRVEAVRPRSALGTPTIVPPPAAPPAAAPDLSAHRGQAGVVLTVEVVGATAGPIWGTDVYTDDTSIATAAVHSGLLRAGERGVVRVTVLPGRAAYTGSERNGVSSSAFGTWPGSFILDRAAPPAEPARSAGPPTLNLRSYFQR
jgi:beta-lactamase regulating signal transducer with metallopeptidase domain